MRIRLIAAITLATLTAATLQAAPTYNDKRPSVTNWMLGGNRSSLGLLDPARLSVHHNVSFSAGFSGGESITNALYASNFTYRLSNPVTLNLMLGVQNSRYSGLPAAEANFSSLFGGFSLDYRPSKNFSFHLQMLRAPSDYLGIYNPYYTPLGMSVSDR